MKRSVTIEGWTLVLRVRVQRKKRKDASGKTRGRYEGKTAHAIVSAPNGERREFYLGSGEKLRAIELRPPAKGEENTRGAPKTPATSRGGRIEGKNASFPASRAGFRGKRR